MVQNFLASKHKVNCFFYRLCVFDEKTATPITLSILHNSMNKLCALCKCICTHSVVPGSEETTSRARRSLPVL